VTFVKKPGSAGLFCFQAFYFEAFYFSIILLCGQLLCRSRRTEFPAVRISTDAIPQCGPLMLMMAATIWPSAAGRARF
jgi:hypothetical protein